MRVVRKSKFSLVWPTFFLGKYWKWLKKAIAQFCRLQIVFHITKQIRDVFSTRTTVAYRDPMAQVYEWKCARFVFSKCSKFLKFLFSSFRRHSCCCKHTHTQTYVHMFAENRIELNNKKELFNRYVRYLFLKSWSKKEDYLIFVFSFDISQFYFCLFDFFFTFFYWGLFVNVRYWRPLTHFTFWKTTHERLPFGPFPVMRNRLSASRHFSVLVFLIF